MPMPRPASRTAGSTPSMPATVFRTTGRSPYRVSATSAVRVPMPPMTGTGRRKPKSARLGIVWMMPAVPSTSRAERAAPHARARRAARRRPPRSPSRRRPARGASPSRSGSRPSCRARLEERRAPRAARSRASSAAVPDRPPGGRRRAARAGRRRATPRGGRGSRRRPSCGAAPGARGTRAAARGA